ncbi:MAG: hypothetical protein R2834_10375 [Rhodothermales bacterium]
MSSSSDTVILRDTFADDRAPGRVRETPSATGPQRLVQDLDGVIGIDHGALRFGYPSQAGWGRECLAYGPFEREAGLAFGVFLLNGHHSSQSLPPARPSLKRSLRRLVGPILHRLGILEAPQNPPVLHHAPALKENLAVGWYGDPAPASPVDEGHGLIVHALGPRNGELWACGHERTPLAVASDIQNIPLYLIVVLRETGAAYYVASLPQAHGSTAFPMMRPVAVVEDGAAPACYAVVAQSTQGEVGFRIESRLYAASIARVEALSAWCGSAHAADRDGEAWRAGRTAARGGDWTAGAAGAHPALLLHPGEATGLLAARWEGPQAGPRGVVLRYAGPSRHLAAVAADGQFQLIRAEDGRALAETPLDDDLRALQILDDGREIRCFLNEGVLLACAVEPDDPADGVGIVGGGCRRFEAHPRAVPIPAALALPAPWHPPEAAPETAPALDGPAGPLDAAGDWERSIGKGVFERTGDGRVRIRATRERPNPGRTAYTVPWANPAYADLEVEIHPPGTERGQDERGRGGLVFWQDPANYFIINTWLDDQFDGTSVSSFHRLDGYEDPFRAVWTNVGRRIRWGRPYRMRARFDGLRYLVSIDDEPVLYRSLQDIYPEIAPLRITRAGLAANWEWGDDTGSLFSGLILRGRHGASPG